MQDQAASTNGIGNAAAIAARYGLYRVGTRPTLLAYVRLESMCSRALWIDEGIIKMDGPSGEVCQAYRESVSIPKRVASTAKV